MTDSLWPLPADPIVEEVSAFAARHRLSARAREIDRHPEFPRAEYAAMGDAGLLGLTVLKELGGRGMPLTRAAVALFHLAYRGGTAFAKLAIQPEFASVLSERGPPALVQEWFRPMVAGRRLVGNQIT